MKATTIKAARATPATATRHATTAGASRVKVDRTPSSRATKTHIPAAEKAGDGATLLRLFRGDFSFDDERFLASLSEAERRRFMKKIRAANLFKQSEEGRSLAKILGTANELLERIDLFYKVFGGNKPVGTIPDDIWKELSSMDEALSDTVFHLDDEMKRIGKE
jgi:hypothetical protein